MLSNVQGSGNSNSAEGLYIMPDIKTGEVTWLNKNTGMRFVREGSEMAAKKKRKSKRKSTSSAPTAAIQSSAVTFFV